MANQSPKWLDICINWLDICTIKLLEHNIVHTPTTSRVGQELATSKLQSEHVYVLTFAMYYNMYSHTWPAIYMYM